MKRHRFSPRRTLGRALGPVAVLLLCAGSVAAVLTGCDFALPGLRPGEPVSGRSPWVNASLIGALEEDTPTNPKDDFYTAVTKDWQLSTELALGQSFLDPFVENEEALAARQAALLQGTPDPEAHPDGELPGLPLSRTAHNLALVQQFAALVKAEDARQAAGAEPARPYLDAVRNISDLEELTAYLVNADGRNIAGNTLVPCSVVSPYSDRTAYAVSVGDTPALSLGDASAYRALDLGTIRAKNETFAQVQYLLRRLGWDEEEITALLHDALRFEQKLVHSLMDESPYTKTELYKLKDNSFTEQELAELAGHYPLLAILAQRGLTGSDRYVVAQPEYLRAVGQLYCAENLEEIKAYCLIHSVPTLMPLLDWESRLMPMLDWDRRLIGFFDDDLTDTPATAETAETAETAIGTAETALDEASEIVETDETDAETDVIEVDTALISTLNLYLAEPFQQLYVARYCTPAQKDALLAMVDELRAAYRTLLQSEDWLSEETRTAALAKLDAMTVRCLYPDHFADYTGLDLSAAETLPDAVAAIRLFEQTKDAALVNQPVGTDHWDFSVMSTTMPDAHYLREENSINLLAGMLATDFFYADDAPEELVWARIGTVIAHEISHGFDDIGAQYDGAGYLVNWWQPDDLTALAQRTARLVKAYNAQPLARGVMFLDYGDTVKSEAIADMAGVKAVLLVAADKPGFDYDTFFVGYAEMWRIKFPFSLLSAFAQDPHPLCFLRVNMTLQQFDEFLETYALQPGDGMYLAPQDRIAVW